MKTLNIQDYEVILFDVDNTLLDFSKSEETALKKLCMMHQMELTKEALDQFRRINHKLWEDYENKLIEKKDIFENRLPLFFHRYGISVKEGAEEQYRLFLSQGAFLIEHAMEVLKILYKTHRLCVVTNGVKEVQTPRLKKAEIEHFFEKFFISEEIGAQKPSSEFFDVVKESLHEVDIKKILLVGDSLNADIRGGNMAGMDTCWFEPNMILQSTLPMYRITSLLELIR